MGLRGGCVDGGDFEEGKHTWPPATPAKKDKMGEGGANNSATIDDPVKEEMWQATIGGKKCVARCWHKPQPVPLPFYPLNFTHKFYLGREEVSLLIK